MKLDLAALRAMNPKAVYDQICSTDVRLSRWDALNMVWQSQVEFMDLKFNVQLPSNDYKLYCHAVCADDRCIRHGSGHRKKAASCSLPRMTHGIRSALFWMNLYWQYARESGVYENPAGSHDRPPQRNQR